MSGEPSDDPSRADQVTRHTPLSTAGRGKPAADVDDEDYVGDNPALSVTDPVPDVMDESVAEAPPDLARAALSAARGMVRRAPRTARGWEVARRNRARNLAGRRRGAEPPGAGGDVDNVDGDRSRRRGGYSAPGPDPGVDPELLGATMSDYIAERGWDAPLAHARVFAEWPALVGADIAAHCLPQSLQDGQLRITAESTAWATQLRLLAGPLLARLVAELGDGVVAKLHITGPSGPSWKHGGWSVRGARGPRDTYG